MDSLTVEGNIDVKMGGVNTAVPLYENGSSAQLNWGLNIDVKSGDDSTTVPCYENVSSAQLNWGQNSSNQYKASYKDDIPENKHGGNEARYNKAKGMDPDRIINEDTNYKTQTVSGIDEEEIDLEKEAHLAMEAICDLLLTNLDEETLGNLTDQVTKGENITKEGEKENTIKKYLVRERSREKEAGKDKDFMKR